MANIYYDYQRVLSYNATFNFLTGSRGCGKTYGAKKFVIKDAIYNGNQFVYLRRYKTELDESCEGFFDALKAKGEFEEVEFTIKKKKSSVEFKADDVIIGYGLTLSTSLYLKSREFPFVKNIVFDEFLIDAGTVHYLKNDVETFLDVVESVGRDRDIRVFLIGNAVQRANPYYNYFDLDTPYGTDIKTYRDGGILVQNINLEEYKEMKRQTRVGKIISDTKYGKYAIENQWKHENRVFIEKRSPQAKFSFNLKINEMRLGVWADFKIPKIYICSAFEPSALVTYVVDTKDHDSNTKLMKGNMSTLMRMLIYHYRNGNLCFETQKIKGIVLPYLNKYVNS